MQANKLGFFILTVFPVFFGLAATAAGPEKKQVENEKTAAASTSVSSSSKKRGGDVVSKTRIPGGGARGRLGYDPSEFMPHENHFGLLLSYGAGYDQLETVERKTLRHQLGVSGTYSFTAKLSSYISTGVSYATYNDKVFRENDDDNYYQLSNLNLGVVYSTRPRGNVFMVSATTLNVALPVSEESRIDQHYYDVSVTHYTQTHAWHKISVYNRITGDYLRGRFKFSIFNGNTLNRDVYFAESIGLNYQIVPSVGFRAGVQVDSTRYLDDTWDTSFGSQASLFANVYGAQVFAGVVNRSYPENERLDMGYYDKYRRLFRIGVTYAF